MADRKTPCYECGAVETSMVHASDPWCGDVCHSIMAASFGVTQQELTAEVFATASKSGSDKFHLLKKRIRNAVQDRRSQGPRVQAGDARLRNGYSAGMRNAL